MPFLTKRQEEILKTLRTDNSYRNVAALQLGITQSALDSHLTRIFKSYLEALETIAEYHFVFAGRLKRHSDTIKAIQKKARAQAREYRRRWTY